MGIVRICMVSYLVLVVNVRALCVCCYKVASKTSLTSVQESVNTGIRNRIDVQLVTSTASQSTNEMVRGGTSAVASMTIT